MFKIIWLAFLCFSVYGATTTTTTTIKTTTTTSIKTTTTTTTAADAIHQDNGFVLHDFSDDEESHNCSDIS